MSNVTLSVNLCNIPLANPSILASRILGTTRELLKRVAENGAGAVTIKSVSTEPREGHKNPTVVTFEAGMLNAVGYSNPGVDAAVREFSNLRDVNVPVIASVIGTKKEDFARVVEGLSGAKFSAIEIPLSCPHTPGFGLLAGQGTPDATFAITSAVRKITKLPSPDSRRDDEHVAVEGAVVSQEKRLSLALSPDLLWCCAEMEYEPHGFETGLKHSSPGWIQLFRNKSGECLYDGYAAPCLHQADPCFDAEYPASDKDNHVSRSS